MKESGIEQYLNNLAKQRKKNRILKMVMLVLAIFIFAGTYLVISRDALTMSSVEENLEENEMEQQSENQTEESGEGTFSEVNTLDVAEVAEEIKAAEVAEEIKAAEVAEEIKAAEVAEEIEAAEVAEEIEAAEVAEEIEANENNMEQVEEAEVKETSTTEKIESIDFEEYITTVTVKCLTNGSYIETTEVKHNDDIKIAITYLIPADTLTEEIHVISYQLPVGIELANEEKGNVISGVYVVGSYIVSEIGYVEITFNDDFSYNQAFSGTINFAGVIDATDLLDGDDIVLPGLELIIEEEEEIPEVYDVYTTKSYAVNEEGTYQYEININTNQGTGETISVVDTFVLYNNATGMENADYEVDSFSIEKVDTSTTSVIESLNVNEYITITNSGEVGTASTFSMDNLPALNKGERYVITYTAVPLGTISPSSDGSSVISNKVLVKSGENSAQATAYAQINVKILEKSGSYDETTGEATWVVSITPGTNDLVGYTLTDEIVTSEGTTIQVLEAELIDVTTGETSTVDLPYTFTTDREEGHNYQLIYITDLNDSIPSNTQVIIANEVKISNGEQEYIAKATLPTIMRTTYELRKESISADTESGTFRWKSTIEIPEEATDVAEDVVYTNTIDNLKFSGYLAESHYTTIADLQEMKLSVNEEVISEENYTIQCTTTDYQTVADLESVTQETKVQNYEITFASEYIEEQVGESIIVEYDTYVDVDKTVEGTEYIVSSTGSIGEKEATAEVLYKKGTGIIKEASTDGGKTYGSTTDVVEYEDIYNEALGAAIVDYKITMLPEMYEEMPELMIDDLPETTEYVANSAVVKFRMSEYWTTESTWINGKQYVASDYMKISEKDGEVIFEIQDFSEIADEIEGLVVEYQVQIPEPAEWEGETQVSYTNTLTCGTDTAINTLSVHSVSEYMQVKGKQETLLTTSGETAYDSDGNPIYTNAVTYTLIANKGENNINDSGNDITVNHTMELDDNSSYASINRTKFIVYKYDANAVDYKGEVINVDSYSYTTSNDGEAYVISITLPDEAAYVVEYTYDIYNEETESKSTSITNETQIENLDITPVNYSITLQETSSNATVVQKTFNIYKYELGNENKSLEGATFYFEKYKEVDGAWQWVETLMDYQTTDEKGFITFQLYNASAEVIYEEDILYRMTETEAPDGYEELDYAIYFVWSAEESTEGTINVTMPEGVSTADITFIREDQTTILVANEIEEVVQITGYTLPAAGGIGSIKYGIVAMILLLLPMGAYVYHDFRIKREREEKNAK